MALLHYQRNVYITVLVLLVVVELFYVMLPGAVILDNIETYYLIPAMQL